MSLTQVVKKKRGVKPAPEIVGIYEHREVLEMVFLEMYMEGYMGVDPQAGLATLERFVTQSGLFKTRSGKPLSFNTIKNDFIELLKEYLKKISGNKKKKK